MGKLKTILVGAFVVGTGFGAQQLKTMFNLSQVSEETPFDYALIVDGVAQLLFFIGGMIIAYAVLAFLYGFVKSNVQDRTGGRPEDRRPDAARPGENRPGDRDRQGQPQDSVNAGQPRPTDRRRQ